MPWWRYISNRALTLFENMMTGAKLSEYHTGYRAFSRRLLEQIDLTHNSDDFVFDNQMFEEASSIGFSRSVRYGLGVLVVSLQYRLARMGLLRPKIFAGLRKS
jgi:hypothetical protein